MLEIVGLCRKVLERKVLGDMERELSIILIEDDTDACKRFTEHAELIEGVSITDITNNSFRGIELVKEKLPDAVILDLELNQGRGNGIQFLSELEDIAIPFKPYILVTTNNSSDVTYELARHLGADFIMSKHQQDYSEKSALLFLKMSKDIIQTNNQNSYNDYDMSESKEQREKRLKRIISKELDLVGISPKVIGYQYLVEAVILVVDGEQKNMCAVIGEKYGKSNSSVERAMQNAINKAWRSASTENLFKYYTARIDPDRGAPTLMEFVYYYANKVKGIK